MSCSWKQYLCVLPVLVCLQSAAAWGTNLPRHRLRSRPIPVDSREDLLQRRPSFGRAVRLSSAASVPTPGAMIGTTYYEYQHNASTGRQVDEDGGKVQTTWMKAPGPSTSFRTVNWNRMNIAGPPEDFVLPNGEVIRRLPFGLPLLMTGQEFPAVRPGYTNFRNRPGGKGAIIYHDAPESGGVQYWEAGLDISAGYGIFPGTPMTSPPPPPGPQYVENAPIWPKQAISMCGSDMIHHAIGIWSGDSMEVWYWRGLINDGAGSIGWNASQPTRVDAVAAGVSPVIEANGDTVVIALAKQINSTNTDLVYYRSVDCGATWEPMVNVTQFTSENDEGLFGEIGAVFDEDGELHIIFNTTPANGAEYPVNLYHWSVSTGIRLITSAQWLVSCGDLWCISCIYHGPGSANVLIAEPNLSVKPAGLHGMAEELIFAVWTQYGPGDSDCATIDAQGTLYGFTNSELRLSVSSDNGLTWDRPQNITGTVTPDCLPGDCYSEGWVSAAARADSGVYLSYVEDKHAGAAIHGEGAWTENPYMVMAVETRLPIPEPQIAVLPVQFIELNADPISGSPEAVSVAIHNTGTATLNYSVSVAPYGGGQSYVTVNGGATYSGSIAPAVAPDLLQIEFNTAGLPDPSEHYWWLEVTSNDPENDPGQGGTPIEVTLQVFAASEWFACDADTLSTLTHRLQFTSCLELGAQGQPGLGFFDLAEGTDWLVSGSPVIIPTYVPGGSRAHYNAYLTPAERSRPYNISFRAQSPAHQAHDTLIATGFPGVNHLTPVDLAWGSACTTDSTIGLEYRVVLPRTSLLSDGMYMTLAMHNRTGTPLSGLTFGAIADFDVTSVGASDPDENQGEASETQGYVAVRGGSADDSANFIPNSNFMALFHLTPGGGCYYWGGGAGQALENAFYLQPFGRYVPDSLYDLYRTFGALGTWEANPHIDTGQTFADLSAMVVFDYNASLNVDDTLVWGFGLAESNVSLSDLHQKIKDLRQSANPDSTDCCVIVLAGDINSSGTVTSADVIKLVNYVFKSGPLPNPCVANGDIDCSGAISSADVIHLVNYVFKLGDAPCDICNDSPIPCEP